MNSTEWIQQTKNRSPGRSGKKSPKCNPGKKSTISDRKKTKKHLEVFERVIGMQFIHNNGEERHSNDHALLCCEGVEMNGDIPAVLTSYVTNLNNSFDQPDPLDIRYVMEQLDPDNKLSGLREKPFNMQRTREQFTDLMERLENCDPNLNGSPPPSPSTPCDEMGLTGTPLNAKCNSGTPDTGTPPSIPLPTVVPPTPVPPRGDGLSSPTTPDPAVDSSVPVNNGGRRDVDVLQQDNVSKCRKVSTLEGQESVGVSRKSNRVKKQTVHYIAGPATMGKNLSQRKRMPDVMHTSQSQNEDSLASESEIDNQTPLEAANNDDSTPLVLPEHFDIHARKHTIGLEIFADSNYNKSIMKLKDKEVLTVYTDGSFVPATRESRKEKAGWGVICVTGGGLKGETENDGSSQKQLKGPVVVDSKKRGFLDNTDKKLSNNTAELSAIGEAILYLLGRFRLDQPIRSKPKLIVIRPDSEYAMHTVQGKYQANANRNMVFTIRRHYRCLLERLQALGICLGWSHVAAHTSIHWNERVDKLAKDAALGQIPSTWSEFRNPLPINRVGDPPAMSHAPIDNQAVAIGDGSEPVSQALQLGPHVENQSTPILAIPIEQIGTLCGIEQTTNLWNNGKIHKVKGIVRECYIFLFEQLFHSNNIVNALHWKKIILLQRVLFTPLKPQFKLDIKTRCKIVLEDRWDVFKIGMFREAMSPSCGHQDPNAFSKKLHTKSSSLLQAGEIARSYKYLQNEFVAIAEPPNVLKEAYKEKLAKKPEEGPNSTMPDLGCADTRNIELDPECVEKVIKQTKRCVTNCPITSNRYEIFKLMVGKNQLPDEQQFLTLLSAFLSVIAVNKISALFLLIVKACA